MLVVALVMAVAASVAEGGPLPDRYGPKFEYNSLESGDEFIRFNYGNQGVYSFAYQLKDQSRFEERDEDGEVRGAFSFVDPEGEEFNLQYLANKKGFQPTADHLPVAPEETDDVKEAREAFSNFYKDTVKYLEALSSDEEDRSAYGRSDEDDDDDSSSEEDDDEESSEESDEESDEDDSSEEDSEEDDDDSDEEEDEDNELAKFFGSGYTSRRKSEDDRESSNKNGKRERGNRRYNN